MHSRTSLYVHTFKTGDRKIIRHLYFCDYLKFHLSKVKKYADLKIELLSNSLMIDEGMFKINRIMCKRFRKKSPGFRDLK
ncbi:GrpB family protein [Coxiella endosymbiont of Ornithodoros amblus]|uniref:GrpB family protein n=1 Tax=Coxiella endosymbiont of Ornithodoros amblus TaxID=1656166 RepID=UPI00244DA4F2|nr:GrpB family protein [Coxiella endosymbiont of Ornithodoros amblus]